MDLNSDIATSHNVIFINIYQGKDGFPVWSKYRVR